MKPEESKLDLSSLQPPSQAELAFEDYLDRVAEGQSVNTGLFVAQRAEEIRSELEGMIDAWKKLRGEYGAGPDLVEGSCSGGYQIFERLGQGGMGTVYAAEEVLSGREVALKILSQEHRYSDEAWARFDREAVLAASINHPRCVFVFGVTQFNERPAIAMERMTGGTLQDEIEAGQALPVAQAVDWILQIVQGLIAAHAAGVLHRDVKPSNCFKDGEGSVKIGDFGISRCLERHDPLTNTGQFLGSPHYAAPEQMRGESVDERTDVYSTAATLYALLCGVPPYPGKTLGDVIARVIGDKVPSARTQNPDVPRALDRALRKAMSKRSDERQKSLAEFHTAIAAFGTFELSNSEDDGIVSGMKGGLWSRFFSRAKRKNYWVSKNRRGNKEGVIPDTNFISRKGTPDHVGSYAVIAAVGDTDAGMYLVAKDAGLKRRVWIHLYKDGYIPEPPVVGPGIGLRWIADGEEGGQRWRVYEDPGGTRLSTYGIRKFRLEWNCVRESLARLCEHLEGSLAIRRLGQVWVDRQGEIRTLDHSLARSDEPEWTPLELLREVSVALLAERDEPDRPRPDFAASLGTLVSCLVHADDCFESLSDARDQLNAVVGITNELSPAQRYGPAMLLALLLLVRPLGWMFSEDAVVEAFSRSNVFDLALVLIFAIAGPWAFITRGGLWCSLVGLEVRRRNGERASRVLCFLQSTCSWLGAFYLFGILADGESPLEFQWLLLPLLVVLPPASLMIGGSPGRTGAGEIFGTCFARGPQRAR